jgi:hypothetical protein
MGDHPSVRPTWDVTGGPPCPCSALLRVGFTEPPGSPRALVRSCRTVSPLPVPSRGRAIGGLFSVALSCGSPRLASRQHPALWSPDLPRPGRRRPKATPPSRDHLAGVLSSALRRLGGHPSVRPTWDVGRATHVPVRPCSGWGLPSRPGRPGRWCALAAPFHPCLCLPGEPGGPSAVCSLWHCPAGRPDWHLASTLPCGAPTFLDAVPGRPGRRRGHPAGVLSSGPLLGSRWVTIHLCGPPGT